MINKYAGCHGNAEARHLVWGEGQAAIAALDLNGRPGSIPVESKVLALNQKISAKTTTVNVLVCKLCAGKLTFRWMRKNSLFSLRRDFSPP